MRHSLEAPATCQEQHNLRQQANGQNLDLWKDKNYIDKRPNTREEKYARHAYEEYVYNQLEEIFAYLQKNFAWHEYLSLSEYFQPESITKQILCVFISQK